MDIKEKALEIKSQALSELDAVTSTSQLEELRIKYLGKKSELSALLKQMGSLDPESRASTGKFVNETSNILKEKFAEKTKEINNIVMMQKLENEALDVTIPGTRNSRGSKHPMSIVLDEIKDIFIGMGFSIAEGPEVELDYYNFTALNTPEGHPARDVQDTFYINKDVLLRTQTSPVQARVMEVTKPPIKIISPGRVFRKDEIDATHSPMFHQIEGLVVDRGVTMADLKGTLEAIVKAIYGADSVVRFRPHHFPFTEPSAELDVRCFACGGEGCSLCKGEGWIELLGCGMVHPNVLRNCGIDPEIYSGFAFGIGLERLAMRRFGVDDMRLFFENDVRFLSQF